jgi:hypothetical protein
MHAAAEAAKASKADYSGLAGSFDQLTGAVTAQTRAQIENQLARSGTLKALATYGISTQAAINAVLGEGQARKVVSAALKSQTAAIADQRRQIALLTAANVADEKAGTLSPQGQAARKRQIDALNAQITAEENVAAAVRNGIPAAKAQHQQAIQNAIALQDWSGKLKGFPKEARTNISLNGVAPTLRSIASVAKAYHLTPKQIQTVIGVTGVTTTVKDVKRVEDGLTSVSKVKPDLSAYKASLQAQMDQAGGIARAGGSSVGYAMSSGLAAALAADRARIAAQSAELVSNAINAARHAADAHSPSRKMAALGRDLMDGLVKGIADREMTVQNAMDRVQALVSKAGSRIANLMSTRSGFMNTFTPDSIFGTDMSAGGDIGSLLGAQRAQAGQASQLLADIKRATGMGLSKSLVSQLRSQGTSGAAALHAIAMGSPQQIKQLNALNKQTSDSLRAAGLRAGDYTRGGSINDDIRRAQRQDRILERLEQRLHELAKSQEKDQTIIVEIDGEAIITVDQAAQQRARASSRRESDDAPCARGQARRRNRDVPLRHQLEGDGRRRLRREPRSRRLAGCGHSRRAGPDAQQLRRPLHPRLDHPGHPVADHGRPAHPGDRVRRRRLRRRRLRDRSVRWLRDPLHRLCEVLAGLVAGDRGDVLDSESHGDRCPGAVRAPDPAVHARGGDPAALAVGVLHAGRGRGIDVGRRHIGQSRRCPWARWHRCQGCFRRRDRPPRRTDRRPVLRRSASGVVEHTPDCGSVVCHHGARRRLQHERGAGGRGRDRTRERMGAGGDHHRPPQSLREHPGRHPRHLG